MTQDPDRLVLYRCTSEACGNFRRKIEAHLNALAVEGCDLCGTKRLEVWDSHRGHILVDWRGQKSVRKRRRRLQDAA